MEKKNVLKILCIIVMTVFAISIYLLIRPKALGNMKHSYLEQTTAISDISFSGESGDRIRFSFRSTIENGDLDIILYDSEGNEVYELDKARELETFFTLTKSDTYTLAADFDDFIGKFDIKAYKAS